MNHKQIQNQGRRYSLYYKYGILFLLAVLTAVCLSGCGAGNRNTGEKETEKPAEELLSETGKGGKEPDIPYQEQIDTIIKNKDMWCFTVPADAPEEYGENESDYYYWISDLDQNGCLEVVNSTTTGNGSVFLNEYYEVSKDGKELIELMPEEDAPSPDLWFDGEFERGYYDRKTGTYHYPKYDHTHSSAINTSDAQLDMVLSDGKITINTLSYIRSKGEPEEEAPGKLIIEYYAGAKEKKLGEVTELYDEEKGEFVRDSDVDQKSEELERKLEKLQEQYYEGMQEFTVTSYSFRNIDEKKYYSKSEEIVVVSDEILRERVEESWDSFGIHFPNETGTNNPFFPQTAAGDTEVKFQIDLLTSGKATMQIQEELRGDQGILYVVKPRDPQELSNKEAAFSGDGLSEADEKKFVKKRFKEYNFYLWVTDTQIYYIPRFYPYTEGDSAEDPDDEGSYIDYDDDVAEDIHQKVRLVFYGELPEYARLVCQEEEVGDTLKEMAAGDHQWIEKHGEDIRCYRSYTSRGEDYDTTGILQFVWKRGEGLIGMRSAAHPAGGISELFWRESYLDVEDVGFSIDADTDE